MNRDMPKMNDTRPRVLTVGEAATALRIGRSTAYRAVAEGEIPSVRIAGSIRVPSAAIDALIATPARADHLDDERPPMQAGAVTKPAGEGGEDERA